MIDNKKNCSALFRQTVKRLVSEGYALEPEDYVEIGKACEKSIAPDRGVSCFVSPPVFVGNVVLEDPSLYALYWWKEYGRDWYGVDGTLGALAVGYICAYSHEKERIDALFSKDRADKALFAFRMHLGTSCTTPELEQAIDILMPTDQEPDDSKDESAPWHVSASEYGGLIARLCALYKKMPIEFLTIPANQCLELLKHAPDKLGGIDETSIDYTSRADFQKAIKRITERLKKWSA
jgi:hypothetical protein